MERSYYVATANPFAPLPKLEDDAEADIVVIGGGITGLSAALSAAEAGLSVILLEAGRTGWGASGRNGGQMIPGWRKGAAELVGLYGEERARFLFDLSLRARDVMLARMALHDIRCDLVANGHLLLAAKPAHLISMREEIETLERVMKYPHARLLNREETQAKVAATAHGGMLDAMGGHLHPLNYALGLADAARRRGVQLYENSAVTSLESMQAVVARTTQGSVRAKHAVLACDALLGDLEPRIAGRIMPVANYLVATAPLENPAGLIADNLAVSDTRFVVNYFRLSADGRLIFGGGERYSPQPPADIAGFVRPFMLEVFPQLESVPIDYAWGGLVSITRSRLPHVGRIGEMFYAHGYSGQGLVLPSIVGAAIAEAITGDTGMLDALATLEPPEFPGGTALRGPLHVLGMLWFALRDRL